MAGKAARSYGGQGSRTVVTTRSPAALDRRSDFGDLAEGLVPDYEMILAAGCHTRPSTFYVSGAADANFEDTEQY